MQAGNWQRWRKIHTTARECPRFEHGVTTIFYLFMQLQLLPDRPHRRRRRRRRGSCPTPLTRSSTLRCWWPRRRRRRCPGRGGASWQRGQRRRRRRASSRLWYLDRRSCRYWGRHCGQRLWGVLVARISLGAAVCFRQRRQWPPVAHVVWQGGGWCRLTPLAIGGGGGMGHAASHMRHRRQFLGCCAEVPAQAGRGHTRMD